MSNFDSNKLMSYFENDVEWIDTSVHNFISNFHHTAAVMQTAIESENFVELCDTAETLKAVTVNFYCDPMSDILKDILDAGRSHRLEEAARLISQLTDEEQHFETDFNEFIQEAYADQMHAASAGW
jgi:hypothetical protein